MTDYDYEKDLTENLLPLAGQIIQEKMLCNDDNISLKAAEDVLKSAGKLDRGNSSGGIVINLGGLIKSAKGFNEVTGGEAKVISIKKVKKIKTKRAICKDDEEGETP